MSAPRIHSLDPARAACVWALACLLGACSEHSSRGSVNESSPQTATDAGAELEPHSLGFEDLKGEVTDAGSSVCVGERRTATLGPLDLVVMLDRSGSMLDLVGGTIITKWDAVREAMKQFLGSLGGDVRIRLQYFPLAKPGSAFECSTQADCGSGGPCLLSFCSVSSEPCTEDLPCPAADDECLPLGQCSAEPTLLCGDIGFGAECGGFGTCVPLELSLCWDATDCSIDAYATPSLESDAGSDADGVADSLDSVEPAGGTPTGPALAGALEQASTFAGASDRTVAAVLVTDGVPTECDPLDIGDIASMAERVRGEIGVQTFVIGVLSDFEQDGAANLELIAQGGGSDQAFFIEPSSNLTNRLLLALSSIRASALDCQYEIPAPQGGGELDYDRVNVDFAAPLTEPRRLAFVSDASACDSQFGGWYYDDPDQPTRIELCDAVCGVIASGTGASVEFEVGCQTQTTILK